MKAAAEEKATAAREAAQKAEAEAGETAHLENYTLDTLSDITDSPPDSQQDADRWVKEGENPYRVFPSS
jgi:hypothetical protein